MSLGQPAHCLTCPSRGKGFLPLVSGEMRSGVLLVGEVLSKVDAEENKALVGSAGHFMGRALACQRTEHLVREGRTRHEVAGPIGREEWGYATALRCEQAPIRPPKAPRTRHTLSGQAEAALRHCRTHLAQVIREREPKAIVALGDVPFWTLTDSPLSADAVRGYPFRGPEGVWVIPTYDPHDLQEGDHGNVPAFLWDLDKARAIAQEGVTPLTITGLVDPHVSVWERWVEEALQRLAADPSLPLALDIETPYKQGRDEGAIEPEKDVSYTILDISLALSEGEAITIPHQMPYVVGLDRLLRNLPAHTTVLAWNGAYDFPRLRHTYGDVLPARQTRDPMVRFHTLYNSLSRGLGFAVSCHPMSSWNAVAWKHLGQQDPLYRLSDAAHLWRLDRDITLLLKATGQDWVSDLFTRRAGPILHAMSHGGLLLDRERAEEARTTLSTRLQGLQTGMTAVVPPALRPFQQWQTKGAAEKGLARLTASGEVAAEAVLQEVQTLKKQPVCGACGAVGIKKSHVTRKTLKGAP